MVEEKSCTYGENRDPDTRNNACNKEDTIDNDGNSRVSKSKQVVKDFNIVNNL